MKFFVDSTFSYKLGEMPKMVGATLMLVPGSKISLIVDLYLGYVELGWRKPVSLMPVPSVGSSAPKA